MFRSFRATNKEIIGLGNFPTANCVRKCRHSLCNANLRPSDTLKTSFVSARERDNAVTTEFLLFICKQRTNVQLRVNSWIRVFIPTFLLSFLLLLFSALLRSN